MSLNDLETFVAVAEHGTFAGAASSLGVPTSTVTRRVARLEERLDVALLRRSSRSIMLTDDGRVLASRCADPLREIARVQRSLQDHDGTPRGELGLTAPNDLAASPFFAQLLAAYRLACPDVYLRVEITNRSVDLLEEELDLALRLHIEELPSRDDLMAKKLGRLEFDLYASPAYLERHGGLQAIADDLDAHDLVAHTTAYRSTMSQRPVVRANDFAALAMFLAAGVGVGPLPSFVAAPYLARGELRQLDYAWPEPPSTLSLVWLRSRHLAPRVRAFIDIAVASAAGHSFGV